MECSIPFRGTTRVGWQIGVGEPIRITGESALTIAVIYYIALVIGVFTIGWVIQQLGKAYEIDKPLGPCIALAAYTATPLFLIGVMEVYPLLWLNLLLGLPALAYTVYLLYSGLPIMMEIPPEKGFVFSSAVLVAMEQGGNISASLDKISAGLAEFQRLE